MDGGCPRWLTEGEAPLCIILTLGIFNLILLPTYFSQASLTEHFQGLISINLYRVRYLTFIKLYLVQCLDTVRKSVM